VGILLEVYALARGRLPLTGHARSRILHTPAGAGAMGAFLCWMLWHWLFDTADLGATDALFAALGAAVGLAGYYYRRAK
jgi:hypothetical protein